MYHVFSHQCPKYCGINICCWQNANLYLYSFLSRKPSTKPSALLCSGAFVHYSRNKEWKSLSVWILYQIRLCGYAHIMWSRNNPLQFEPANGTPFSCVGPFIGFGQWHIFITPRDLPNNSPLVHVAFKVLINFFPQFYKPKLNFHWL